MFPNTLFLVATVSLLFSSNKKSKGWKMNILFDNYGRYYWSRLHEYEQGRIKQ